MVDILIIIFFIYTFGFFVCLVASIMLEYSDWKYAYSRYIILFPIIPLLEIYNYSKQYYNHLNKTKMNLKVLLKAMSFMFLPTFAVLLMLLVGFFDPIALWEFIKSSNGWAIFLRIILFIIEVVFVGLMYEYYNNQEKDGKIISSVDTLDEDTSLNKESGDSYIYRMFPNYNRSSDHKFLTFKTKNPDILIVKRIQN